MKPEHNKEMENCYFSILFRLNSTIHPAYSSQEPNILEILKIFPDLKWLKKQEMKSFSLVVAVLCKAT